MEDIRRFYGSDPKGYAEATDRDKMPKAFLDVRDTFLDYVDEKARGDRILDAGCGPGDDTAYFVDQGYDAVGVDVTPEMVSLARDQHEVEYRVMDINNMDFEDETFDGVWANTVVFHVPLDGMQEDVEELYRVLRDDGVMHISYKLGADTEGREIEKDVDGVTLTQYRVTNDEARNMLEKAGFTIGEERTEVNTDGDRLFGNYFCQK